MPWNIKLHNDNKIIKLDYSGLVTPQELKNALDAAVALSEKKGITLFLADCSEMIGGHSVVDLYYFISLLEATGISRIMKEALLLPQMKSSVKDVEFYETTCSNRGLSVKVFPNIEDAIIWLYSEFIS
jgi:hypothetical protein